VTENAIILQNLQFDFFHHHNTLSYVRAVCEKVQSSLETNSCSEKDGYANSRILRIIVVNIKEFSFKLG
jgi:hypothetical protein